MLYNRYCFNIETHLMIAFYDNCVIVVMLQNAVHSSENVKQGGWVIE